MSQAVIRVSRPWVPVAVAAVVSAVLLALASGPFEPPATRTIAVEAPVIRLVSPVGTVSSFPVEFRWEPVTDTTYYLAGFARVTSVGTEPVYREQVESTILRLPSDVRPGPGEYAWEVYAFGDDGFPMAKGAGRFRVTR